jgi:hypothetical protein
MTPAERVRKEGAIAYCRAIGLDPFELVYGTVAGPDYWTLAPRWIWYQAWPQQGRGS